MNIDAILKELEDTARDATQVKCQNAMLRAAAAIKVLQGRLLIQEGEALFFSVNEPKTGGAK